MIPVSISELAAILRGGEQEGILALLRAYFDASATDPSKGAVYAVGGFVGREGAWIKAEAEWKEGLRTFQLNEFHLADIIPNLGHEMGGLCILHFSKIVGRSGLRGIGASCDIEHWKNRDTGYANPYHFCFSMALNILREDVSLELGGEPVALVVDDDVKPRDVTEGVFAAYQEDTNGQIFKALAFGNRRTFLPIQCADLAVGALRKEWLEGILSDSKKTLKEFQGAIGS
ncbi:hypothetical protein [Mesorhizobium helmanticense]|uniref:Uncharacterized protein n=1 Tax=Mesorhizobium helmanticense TaxID=1776423 RepID=A0A2T4IPN1_9HYPH|nr:hypothetical protein [Mesorhizobium helmanticense]PTE07580.1 hypothetical protein C9427_26055 [Mesorhizobium helmanticense]